MIKKLSPNNKKETCFKCGNLSNITKQIDSKPVCSNCYRKFFSPQSICYICGALSRVESKIDGNPICPSCYRKIYNNKRKKEACSECGVISHVAKRIDSKPVCSNCYKKFYSSTSICNVCGEIKRVEKRINGNPICSSCYNKNYRETKKCFICGALRYVHKINDGQPICNTCYKKTFRPKHICSICNKSKIATVSTKDGKFYCQQCYLNSYVRKRKCFICGCDSIIVYKENNKDICNTCYTKYYRPRAKCSICGNIAIISKITESEKICNECYYQYRPKRDCYICGKHDHTHKIVEIDGLNKFICQTCYKKHYQPKYPCGICGKNKNVAAIIDGIKLCDSCYRGKERTCVNCGSIGKFAHSIEICDNCWFKRKIEILKVNSSSLFSNLYAYEVLCKYVDIINEFKTSRTAYYNFSKALPIFLDLENYIKESNVISTELFYSLFAEFHLLSLKQIANFLVSEGFLEDLPDEILIKKHIIKESRKLTSTFNTIYHEYSYYLIQIHNSYIAKGWSDKFSVQTVINYSHLIVQFLDFSQKECNTINELNDNIIEKFLCNTSPYYLNALRHFIKWANKNVKFFKKLTLLHPPKRIHDINPYNEREYIDIMENLNTSNATPKEKLISLLLLLYGIRPHEIIKLRMSNYTKLNNDSYIYIRNTWIKIHPYLSQMFDEYINFSQSNKSFSECNNFLFLGSLYNKPMHLATIYKLLKKYNISTNRAFSSVITKNIIEFDNMPYCIIKGLGLSINTVMAYYRIFNISNSFEIENSAEAYKDLSLFTNNNNTIYVKYYVYILRCSDGSYYTGYTSDIQKRFNQHQSGHGCSYTKTRTPVELVYTEESPDKPSALKRENQIKKLDTYKKEQLIQKSRID